MSFCRDLCDGVAGNFRNCMTTPITRTKMYWAGGISLFIILFIVILCVSLPSGGSSVTQGRQALYDSPFSVGVNYIASGFYNKKKVGEFDKNLVKYVSESLIKVQIFGVRADCSAQYKDAPELVMEQVDYLYRLIPTLNMKLATTVKDITTASSNGAVSALVAINGGHSLGLTLSSLRTFHRMGVRIMSITSSNCTTPWAKAAINPEKPTISYSLTDFGKAVVREMNRLGIMIDIAGADTETQSAILDESKAPVVAIGVGLKANKMDPFNLDQNIVPKFNEKGGILMLTMNCSLFATANATCEESDFTKLLEQAKTASIKVGIGGVFQDDGFPKGMSFKDMPTYFDSLHNKGYSMEFLRGLSGDNFLKALKVVEEVARSNINTAPEEMQFDKSKLPAQSQTCYTDIQMQATKRKK